MFLPWLLSNSKSYCAEVKLLVLEKYITRCTLLTWLFIRHWIINTFSFTVLEKFLPLSMGEYELRKIWTSVFLKMVFVLAKYIQMEKEFCMLIACESSKDVMIAVDASIKYLVYQKKLNWCFASTFSVADSKASKTSKINI